MRVGLTVASLIFFRRQLELVYTGDVIPLASSSGRIGIVDLKSQCGETKRSNAHFDAIELGDSIRCERS